MTASGLNRATGAMEVPLQHLVSQLLPWGLPSVCLSSLSRPPASPPTLRDWHQPWTGPPAICPTCDPIAMEEVSPSPANAADGGAAKRHAVGEASSLSEGGRLHVQVEVRCMHASERGPYVHAWALMGLVGEGNVSR
jgi:hypothetical protein